MAGRVVTAREPICVQIAALGGQGGGVLAEWLGEAARLGGYPAQATSIPGVAQRTGATTYYFEMYPERDCAEKPVFCLSPDMDGLDLMVAMEPLEAARALEHGLISERTTVLTATRRLYSTAEKSLAGEGAMAAGGLFRALEGAARTVVGLDLDAIGGKPGGPGNAVMFGAIAAAGILPMAERHFEQAIRIKNVAVEASLADFSAGLKHGRSPLPQKENIKLLPTPERLCKEVDALPESGRPLAGHVCAGLIDYQDEAYARLFLRRIEPFAAASPELVAEVYRRLGAWMTYGDVIRVAQLKTRPGRLARIRAEAGIDEKAPLRVVEFLKPGREELAGLLPPAIGAIIMRGHKPSSTSGLRLRLASTGVFGYGAMKALAGLRRWRRRTYRYQVEQQAIEGWLAAVRLALESDPGLAVSTARLALLARGYGGVRSRGMANLDRLFGDWAVRLEDDPASLSMEVDKLLHQALHDPDNLTMGKQR